MNEPTLRQIKEEMRITIIFYAVDAFSKFGELSLLEKTNNFIRSNMHLPDYLYKDYIRENKIDFFLKNEKDLESLEGRTAVTEILCGSWDGREIFHEIKEKICDYYTGMGFGFLAKKAKMQVNEDYVMAGLKKYFILNDNDAAKDRSSYRVYKLTDSMKADRNEVDSGISAASVRSSISWIILVGILITFISGFISLFVDVDTRTDAEKVRSAYCEKLGKTC